MERIVQRQGGPDVADPNWKPTTILNYDNTKYIYIYMQSRMSWCLSAVTE